MVVLPRDFQIGEPNNALVSFSRGEDSDLINERISMTSKVQFGQGDLIELYLSQYERLLSLTKDLPAEITIRIDTKNPVNDEGR